MMPWRAEAIPMTVDKTGYRSGLVRALGIAVAALITANGVVVTEQLTHRDLINLATDGFDNARNRLADLLEPDGTTKQAGGVDVEDTTTTTAASPDTAAPPTTAPPAVAGVTVTAPAPTSTTVPPVTAPVAAAPAANPLDQLMVTASAFVEKERGLRFTAPVKVTGLDDAAFKAKLNAVRLGPALARAQRDQGLMRALGIIGPDVDLAAQVRRLSTGGVSAFYDAKGNELFVHNGPITPFARKTIVHELAKALDDQHFELDRPNVAAADDEAGAAFEALYEGVATRIENHYVAGLPDADKKAVATEGNRLAAQVPKDLPPIVLVTYGFPYAAGPKLADAILAAGGTGRLDKAMQNPPSTTEQVLHPEKYLAGEGPKPAAGPAADGGVVRQGSLGQLDLSMMLAQVLDAGYAEGAADGWGGDQFVVWQNGNQTCARLSIVMDTPDDNTDMSDALNDWAADRPGAKIEGTGPFTVTSCS
jgi:hypothetical protein